MADPTSTQLANQLNPQAYTVTLPTSGLFTDSGQPFGSLYTRTPEGLTQIDVVNTLLTPQERQQAGGYGAQLGMAIDKLKNQYGFDITSIPKLNLADVYQGLQRQGLGSNDASGGYRPPTTNSTNINEFLQAKPAQTTTQTLNSGQNQLASPGEMASAVAQGMRATSTAPQSQSIPSTQLQPGATGDQVKQLQDFLVSKGFMTQAQVNTGYGTYGPQTTAAVAKLQQSLGVDNSSGVGYFGPKTIAALNGGNMQVNNQSGVTGSSAISASSLSGDANPISTVGYNPNSSGADNLVAGATAYDQQVRDAQASEQKTQGSYEGLSSDIQGLLNSSTSQASDQASAEQQYGVADKKQALDAVNGQIQTKIAQYNALSADIAGKPITMDSIIGSQAQVKNAAAADIGLLQAQASALQGQYDTAVQLANHAADLKYQDQQNILDVKLKQLDLVKDELSTAQKKTADALTRQYNAQKDALAVATANEKDKNSTLLNLLQSYPDAGISLSDSLEGANKKITANSKIYQNSIRQVNGGGSGLLSVSDAQALGVPYGTSQAEAAGITPTKPATAVQETTALYANRLEQSNKIISDLDKYAATSNPLTYAAQQKLPGFLNILKSGDFQSLEQAQRNFVNAVLRRESGAVISPAEFDSAKQQYFVQPGDSQKVIDQKKANRDLVMKGFITGSGSAYSPLATSGILKSPDGSQQVNTSELTPAQIQEAKDNGWQ